jgi:hypothetical protein
MRSLSIFTLAVLLIAMLAAVPAAEAKGPPKGKGQVPELKISSDAEEIAEEKAKEAKKLRKRKMKQKKEKLKGLEKQQTKKAEQVQKETGKGSEKGQAMRKEHSKKWWKFGFGKEEEPSTPVAE